MSRPRTTDFLALDVRQLLRAGVRGCVRWNCETEALFTRGPRRLTIWLGRRLDRVVLTETRQHFGGVRWWASCPGCSRRCAVLLLARRAGWRCRWCLGAVYPVTREGSRDQALRRARRARARLGIGPNLCEPILKPPGMHFRKFLRLAERAEDAAGAVFAAVRGDIERMERSLTRGKEKRS